MPTTSKVFVDTSVLFAATYSATGYARDLIRLGLQGKVILVISDDVLEEVKRNLADKAPGKLGVFTSQIEGAIFEVVGDPTRDEVLAAATYTVLKDAPIVAAAIKAQVDYLVTYDHKHLLDRPEVAEKSGLRIVTPDVVVTAIQEQADD